MRCTAGSSWWRASRASGTLVPPPSVRAAAFGHCRHWSAGRWRAGRRCLHSDSPSGGAPPPCPTKFKKRLRYEQKSKKQRGRRKRRKGKPTHPAEVSSGVGSDERVPDPTDHGGQPRQRLLSPATKGEHSKGVTTQTLLTGKLSWKTLTICWGNGCTWE